MKPRKLIITVLTIFLIALLIFNFSTLQEASKTFLEEQLVAWGYVAVFIVVLLSEGVPQPLFSSIVVYTLALLLGFEFEQTLAITIVAAVIANYLAYFFGKEYSDKVMGVLISKSNYQKGQKWFDKYGKSFIGIVALTPLPYFPILGGMFKMTLRDFSLYAVLARIAHFLVFGTLIYYLL